MPGGNQGTFCAHTHICVLLCNLLILHHTADRGSWDQGYLSMEETVQPFDSLLEAPEGEGKGRAKGGSFNHAQLT